MGLKTIFTQKLLANCKELGSNIELNMHFFEVERLKYNVLVICTLVSFVLFRTLVKIKKRLYSEHYLQENGIVC